MPIFYFDIEDGALSTGDSDGLELPDRKAARDEAIRALPNIARDVLPNGDHHDFRVRVRDESGRSLFKATLALTTEWLDEGPDAAGATPA